MREGECKAKERCPYVIDGTKTEKAGSAFFHIYFLFLLFSSSAELHYSTTTTTTCCLTPRNKTMASGCGGGMKNGQEEKGRKEEEGERGEGERISVRKRRARSSLLQSSHAFTTKEELSGLQKTMPSRQLGGIEE